jgi:predicted metal-dependent enzyme (double-stranded beta helix superfamily)
MFDTDQLIAECQEARVEPEPRLATKEVLLRFLARPGEIADAMRPTEGGLNLLHQSDDLTIINVVWAPGMVIYPHDHRMWAVLGIYSGREENTFYRRSGPDEPTLVESGGKSLHTGDLVVLGDDVIHAVANPLDRLTGAIHVYGGDFVNQPRSQWGPGPREERPFDFDEAERQFAEANRAWFESNAQRRGN